jgi:hypothetical protein
MPPLIGNAHKTARSAPEAVFLRKETVLLSRSEAGCPHDQNRRDVTTFFRV